MFNELENSFLKLLNLDFVDSIDERIFITSNNEKFTLCQNPIQVGFNPKRCIVFDGDDKRIWLEKEKTNYRMVKVVVNKDDDTSIAYTLEENTLENGVKKVVFSFYDRDNRRNHSIIFEPDYKLEGTPFLVVHIQNNKDFFCSGYITCSLSYVEGFDVGALQQDRDLEACELSVENYEKVFEKLISVKYCYDKEVKDYFLSLMPLFSKLYDSYKELSNETIQCMLDALNEERDYINSEADEKIAEINEERQAQLKENAKMHKKLSKMLK